MARDEFVLKHEVMDYSGRLNQRHVGYKKALLLRVEGRRRVTGPHAGA